MDVLLAEGVTNSEVVFERIAGQDYKGGKTTVKNYISAHADLVPAKRKFAKADPRGSRGRRFETKPVESCQIDWGFVKVEDWAGGEFKMACFAMVCHHCETCYVEFFPSAQQENLFIDMIHAFMVMGVPNFENRSPPSTGCTSCCTCSSTPIRDSTALCSAATWTSSG